MLENNVEQLRNHIKEIIKEEYSYRIKDHDTENEIGIEIYCDYNDRLSDETIKEIMKSDNPRAVFEDKLYEWGIDYSFDYGYDQLTSILLGKLSEEEREIYYDNETEMVDFIRETFYFYYPEEHFNESVKVNIMLDTGNMNYDFTCDNVLNWYGRDSKGEFDENSSILWLAKQQGKAELLQKCCKESIEKYNNNEQKYREETDCEDKFVVSTMHELANLTSHMGTLTFLVEMDLFDLFKLKEAMQAEKELNESYYLEERKGTGYIVLDKKTDCGLFDSWNGTGSLLEIECENDIIIPIKCIYDAVVDGTRLYGYDVNEVYGLVDSCWKESLKEINCMKI